MIFWLASYPRSGNTFARLVLQQLYGLPMPTIYQPRVASPASPAKFVDEWQSLPELLHAMRIDDVRAAAEPYLVKTHEFPTDDSPAIYLVRDGRDALVSHTHYVLNFDYNEESTNLERFREVLQAMIETETWFGGWSDNVLAWTTRSAPTVILHFEDLIAAPEATLQSAVARLGVNLPDAVVGKAPEFAQLHARAPDFFRRGEVNSWRHEMPADLHELFWQHHGDAMDWLGYARSVDNREALPRAA